MNLSTNLPAATEAETTDRVRRGPSPTDLLWRYALQVFTVLALIIIGILVPNFRQPSNL